VENKYLKERLTLLEERFNQRESETDIRIKALETLFLENRVPTYQTLEDEHSHAKNPAQTAAFQNGMGAAVIASSKQPLNFSDLSQDRERRSSLTDNASEMRSRRVSMEAQNDYRNAAIDLGNQNQTAKQQDNAVGISSTRRAKYARDEPADAN